MNDQYPSGNPCRSLEEPSGVVNTDIPQLGMKRSSASLGIHGDGLGF